MKAEILKYIVCKNCGSSDFEIVKIKATEEEIDVGFIGCKNCGYWYPVINKILYMTPELYKKTIHVFIEENLKEIPKRILEFFGKLIPSVSKLIEDINSRE